MLKFLAVGALALAALAAPLSAARAQTTYKIGISAEPYPPFYAPNASGEWTGWEIDFTHALCKRLDAKCVITPVAWEGIIPALKTGKIDMIIGSMSDTPERAKQIAFSKKYYNTPTGLVALKSSDFKPTPEGLKGAYLGVQSGSVQQAYADKYFAKTVAGLQVYQTLDEELQDLVAGRIDAVLGDTLAMQPFIKSKEGKECCEYRGAVKDDKQILGAGVSVGLRKGDTELLKRVNAAIDDIRADGTYAKITKKYFNFDIYGG